MLEVVIYSWYRNVLVYILLVFKHYKLWSERYNHRRMSISSSVVLIRLAYFMLGDWWDSWIGYTQDWAIDQILRTSSRKGLCVVSRRQWSGVNNFYMFLYKLQFQSAHIILSGVLFFIHTYMCQVYRYGYSCFQWWIYDIGSILL